MTPRKKKNPAAVELGRRGGAARTKALTPEQREALARRAARARWSKKPDSDRGGSER
jgi:hypothetical protein